jgi:hypothetical protein
LTLPAHLQEDILHKERKDQVTEANTTKGEVVRVRTVAGETLSSHLVAMVEEITTMKIEGGMNLATIIIREENTLVTLAVASRIDDPTTLVGGAAIVIKIDNPHSNATSEITKLLISHLGMKTEDKVQAMLKNSDVLLLLNISKVRVRGIT